ncbi:MAG: hypothetical protein C4542_02335 [Dehalococcoidia bacterium]|nr:MAG: hypothetical protein C4542_02335 [Dehalococcoidia bacterium]
MGGAAIASISLPSACKSPSGTTTYTTTNVNTSTTTTPTSTTPASTTTTPTSATPTPSSTIPTTSTPATTGFSYVHPTAIPPLIKVPIPNVKSPPTVCIPRITYGPSLYQPT